MIETKNLTIAPFTERYITEKYVSWLNDKNIMRYSEQRHHTYTEASCRAYFDSFKDSENLYLAIEIRKTNHHVGNITVHIDAINHLADIGLLMAEQTIFAFEAWNAVCTYVLQHKNIRKITAGTLSVNEAILKIFQRSGMVEDGRRHKHYINENQEVDICNYAFFNKDFIKIS